jgi:hypothetical protein
VCLRSQINVHMTVIADVKKKEDSTLHFLPVQESHHVVAAQVFVQLTKLRRGA